MSVAGTFGPMPVLDNVGNNMALMVLNNVPALPPRTLLLLLEHPVCK
jgi:hypothetical protein